MTLPSAPLRRVLLLHTGGTLGMRRGERGYAPAAGHLAELITARRLLEHPDLPGVELVERDPLKDSSDLRPGDWQRIADVIVERQQGVAGFVILHGTDTMAYTASALSFLLGGLDRPVVLTGSQIPLAEARSDAAGNLVTALQLAASGAFAEVAIYMNGVLLRGNRATKVSVGGFDAFESPNAPPLARVGATVRFDRQRLRRPAKGPLRAAKLRDRPVLALRLFPGISASTLRNVLADPVRGMILETFGSGNAPEDPELLAELERASERGLVIVATSQCLRGRVDMASYAAGSGLAAAGVVSGLDMTAEAALTKLSWLLSLDLGPDEVRRRLGRDLRGELTPSPDT